jgi:DMSO/TMAO reductase YedYZ molybdopterin-dependent catalytic subunit
MGDKPSTPSDPDKLQRVVEARLKLRERFLTKMAQTPGRADLDALGSGAPNRHGMPRLPPEQTETRKWPVLDLSGPPNICMDQWKLEIDGCVEQPVRLDWAGFQALPQTDDVSDFHCVTSWSRMDLRWRGVQVSTLLALARPRPEAAHLLVHAYDGYTTNVPLEEALKDDVLLVHTVDGQPLPDEHGGPLRMITPQLWAWKGAKWVRRLEVLEHDQEGFWEKRGYSNTAHPWRNDRYS